MSFTETIASFGRKYKAEIQTFKVVFFMGLLVHLSIITNKYFNYFEMGNILMDMSYEQGDTLAQGRWFIPVVTNLFTVFSTPLLNGIVCMAYMSVSAVLILKMLGVREKLYAYLFGGIWIAFPGMASIMSYGVNADVFCFCIFTAVLSVYLSENCKFGIIWGSIVLCLSIGAYQPYLAVAIGVAYCILLLEALSAGFDFRRFCIKTAKLLGMLLLGFLLYYAALHAILAITGMELSNYHGVDNMTSFTPKGIAKGLVYTYGYFLTYLFTANYTYTIGRILWNVAGTAVFLTVTAAMVQSHGKAGVSKKDGYKRNRILQTGVVVIMVGLLPLGMNSSPFLMGDRVGNGVDRYMMQSMMLIWGLLFRLLELSRMGTVFKSVKWRDCLQWVGVLSGIAVLVSGVVICNEAYHRLDAMTTTTESMLTRIAGRMEAVPEWNKDMPVYFVNPQGLVNENYHVEIPKYDALKQLPGTEVKPWYNERAIKNYMQTYLHFPVRTATEEQKADLDTSAEVQNMPMYPAADSIQVIDGVLVIKVSDRD